MKCPWCRQDIEKDSRKCHICQEYVGIFDRITRSILTPIITALISGGLLFYAGQTIERQRFEKIKLAEQEEQNNKIIIFLKKELSQNHANLNNIKMLLTKNLEDLKNEKITITPLGKFYFDAWEKAKYSNAKFLIDADTKDFMKLSNCYFVLHIIENKVRDRELYRIYNEGKLGFIERVKKLDQNILDTIEKLWPIISQSQEYLDTIHDWKVSGGSFYTEDGLVVDIRKDNPILQNNTQTNPE